MADGTHFEAHPQASFPGYCPWFGLKYSSHNFVLKHS